MCRSQPLRLKMGSVFMKAMPLLIMVCFFIYGHNVMFLPLTTPTTVPLLREEKFIAFNLPIRYTGQILVLKLMFMKCQM